MRKKFIKGLVATSLVTAFTASSFVPVLAAEQPATAAHEISSVIVENDGVLFSLSLKDYIALKLAKSDWLNGVKIKYIESTNKKSYPLGIFISHKTSQKGLKVEDALDQLAQKPELAEELKVGKVTVGDDGVPVITPPEDDKKTLSDLPDGAYEIDSSLVLFTDRLYVNIYMDKLSDDVKNGPSFKLILDGTEYTFVQNSVAPNTYSAEIPSSYTVTDIKAGEFQ